MPRPRIYELALVIEPRQSEENVQAIVDRNKTLITDSGAEVVDIEDWGKRKLAYPIENYTEGRYIFLHVTAEGATPPWPDIERLLQQNEQVLRHLVVRTDLDKKRAETRAARQKPRNPKPDEADEAGSEDS